MLFLLAPLAGLCQKPSGPTIDLIFERPAPRTVWFGKPTEAMPENATKAEDAKVSVPLPGETSGMSVIVLDERSGNLAAKPFAPALKEWKLTAADFKLVYTVQVRVEYKGDPVAAANVRLEDGAGKAQSQLLDPSANGTLTFYAVEPGDLSATVEYKTEGKDATPYAIGMSVPLDRDRPQPVIVVSLPDPAQTVGAKSEPAGDEPGASDGKAGTGAEPREAPRQNGAFDVITLLLTLGVLGTLGYFAFRWFKQDPSRLPSTLKKLGAEMPEPLTDDGSNPGGPQGTPVPPAAPAPPQKILLDDAAPTPLGAASSAPAVPAAPLTFSGNPTLKMDSGEAFPLEEGLFTIGREDGLPLSFPGESTISRRHAEILNQNGRVTVTDLGSTNGTFVNGRKIDAETELRPGDKVQFGSVRFKVES